MSLLNAVQAGQLARSPRAETQRRTHFDKAAQSEREEERREVKLVARLASQSQNVLEHDQVRGDGFGDDAVKGVAGEDVRG